MRAQGLTNTIILTFHFPARLSRLQDSLLDGGGGTPQIQQLERWTVLSNAQRGQNTETSTPKGTRESRLLAPGLGSSSRRRPARRCRGGGPGCCHYPRVREERRNLLIAPISGPSRPVSPVWQPQPTLSGDLEGRSSQHLGGSLGPAPPRPRPRTPPVPLASASGRKPPPPLPPLVNSQATDTPLNAAL